VADYNANIKVNADTRQAERSISQLEKSLNRISSVRADIGNSVQNRIKDIKSEAESLGKSFQRLGGIIKTAAFTGGFTALGTAVLDVSNKVGNLGSLIPGIGDRFAAQASAASQSLNVVQTLVERLSDAVAAVGGPGNAAGIAAITTALVAFGPQITRAAIDTEKLGAALGDFASKGQRNINPIADAVTQLNQKLEVTNASFQDLISGSTLNQLNAQLSDANFQVGEFLSSTQEAVTAAEQLVAVQREQRLEQKAIADLVRQAQGLQPQNIRDAEVARRVALLKSREIQQKKDLQLQNEINIELAEYEKLAAEVAQQTKEWANNLDRIARSSRAGVFGSSNQIQSRLQEFRENRASADIARQRSAELLARERSLAGSQYSIGQVPARGELFPGGRTETASPQFRNLLNEQARVRQAAAEAIAKSEKTITGFQAQTLRTEQNITTQKRIQQEQDQKSINILRERNQLLLEGFKAEQRVASGTLDPASLRADRLRRIKEGRERQKAFAERTANVTLGAGFPLLFGGGPGAVIGGGLGGALAGGPQALAAQIGLSAVGQILDQFGASAAELSAALNPLTLDVEKLIPALGATNTETAEYLRKLDELGRQDEALAVATEELARIIGFDGVRALRDYGDAVVSLNNEWSKLITQLQAGLAKLLEGPVRSVATRLERSSVLSQARESTDPRIQLLFAQRRNASFSDLEGIDTQIIALQKEINQAAEKRAALEQQKSVSFDQQVRLLTAQTELAALGNDLTNQAVFKQQELVIQKQKELEIAEAQGDAEKIAIADARARLSLQQLRSDQLTAQLAAEERLTKEFEKQRKEIEKIEKKRREELGEAQTGFVLSGLELQVQATTGDDKAKRIAEFNLERAQRIAQYTEKIKEALSDEERRFILAKQENDIFTSQLRLQEDLFQIDLKRSELLNSEDPLGRANEEIALLQAKINGTEKGYLLQKQISDLLDQGVTQDVAEATALTIRDLEAQNAAIQAQKQLWKDIYTSITGNITSAVEGLIAGTQTWGELLSNILGSLGTLFLNQGFNALGTSLGLTGFAEGGFVTGPTRALIGEGGESEYVIPASKMKSAMNRYAAGARGNAVLSGGDETSGGGMATMAPAAIDVRYNVERINNVDYVTNQEFQAGLQQAATQGAERGQQLALRRLQQSVTTRRRLGI
jgi:hypothetical protein